MIYKLFFDTADKDKITVKLFMNGKQIAEKKGLRHLTSQILLPLIYQICRVNKITPLNISEIEFNPGPGSYTGLKIGAAVANAFGWFLKIPVNGRKNKIIKPIIE